MGIITKCLTTKISCDSDVLIEYSILDFTQKAHNTNKMKLETKTPHSEPSANYTITDDVQPKDPCIRDLCCLAIVPCAPIARATSWVGMSYTAVFLVILVVVGGGSICYVVSSQLYGDLSILESIALVVLFNAIALVPSLTVLLFSYCVVHALAEGDTHGMFAFEVDSTYLGLVFAYMWSQVLYVVIVAYLRRKILLQAGAKSSCHVGCCGVLYTWFFPWCSFADAMKQARSQMKDYDTDEIPAFKV